MLRGEQSGPALSATLEGVTGDREVRSLVEAQVDLVQTGGHHHTTLTLQILTPLPVLTGNITRGGGW